MTEECGEIVFWTLRKKFVASSDEMPEHSSQVMYYSLAIGHHVGVIDCLNVAFRCPLTEYEDWLAQVEEEQARRLRTCHFHPVGQYVCQSYFDSLSHYQSLRFVPAAYGEHNDWGNGGDCRIGLDGACRDWRYV